MLALPQLEKKEPYKLDWRYLILLYLLVGLFSFVLVFSFKKVPPLRLLGLGLIIFSTNLLYGLYLFHFHRSLLQNKGSFLKYSLFLMAVLFFVKVGAYSYLPLERFSGEMVLPIGLVSLVIALGYSLSLGLITTLWLSFYAGFIIHPQIILSPEILFPLVAGGGASVFIFQQIQTPVGLRRFGFLLGVIQATVYYGVLFFKNPSRLYTSSEVQTNYLMYPALWWFLNGLLTGWLLSELLPVIEKIFNIVTNISLHKLAEQNHPLLKRLNLLAPGTYHHSIMVGTLSEAAAEAVGANALLARVGSNFHDIGKMIKPDYYIENISPHQKNKHDGLSPSMSALIIMAHPRDGAEMGREYGLPQRLIDFMEEHHGTTMVKFFYQKALKLAEESGEEVDEASFRYPGPKPQTKETAIAALADPIEAASRTLVDPTPASIQRLVEALVDDRVQDGQMDECELTMEEIRIIKKTFIRMLLSIFHGRISYDNLKDDLGNSLDKRKDAESKKTSIRARVKN